MNLAFLPPGPAGVVLAALISLVVGVLALGLFHAWGKRNDWTPAAEIGWAWLATMVATASIDCWNLLHLGLTPRLSPAVMQRVLDGIHDPAMLGTRVVCEFIGTATGVMLGWLIWTGAWRAGHRSDG